MGFVVMRLTQRRWRPRYWLFAVTLSAFSCASPRPSALELGDEPAVVLKTVNLGGKLDPYAAFAHHAWIDVRESGSARWTRLEVDHSIRVMQVEPEFACADERWSMPVRVLASWHGDEAARLIPRLFEVAHSFVDEVQAAAPSRREQRRRRSWAELYSTPYPYHPWQLKYEAWPGPNSNTFVAELLDGVPGMGAELDHNAVGKDWVRGFRLGRTDGGLGLEIDATYLGAAVGFYQGLELHLMGLTAGFSLWPPALKIPFFPRIGVHPGWVRARW